MSSFEWPDLSSLASLARQQSLDLRPILLRVHTDLFVSAPGRDRATVEAFEALALGFLPTVDEATAVIIARKLAPVADTPARLIEALIARGGEAREAILSAGVHGAGLSSAPKGQDNPASKLKISATHRGSPDQDLPDMQDDETDIALARNHSARIGSRQFRELVDRARHRPQLAMALLARPDLGIGDETALYVHADDARRAQIRAKLQASVAVTGSGPSLGRPDSKTLELLLASAQALDIPAFEAHLADVLHLSPAPMWDFQAEPRRELLALALVAAGIGPEDCIRIFLTIHPSISRSVKTVHRLAEIARTVTRPVATHLLEAILGITVAEKREARHLPATDPSIAPARMRSARPTVREIRTSVLARRAG